MSLTVSSPTSNYYSGTNEPQKKDNYSKEVVKSSNDGRYIVVDYKKNGEPYERVTHHILGKRFDPPAYQTISEKGNDGKWHVKDRVDFKTMEDMKKYNEQRLKEFENLKNNGIKIEA
jgi:hypothetical protein